MSAGSRTQALLFLSSSVRLFISSWQPSPLLFHLSLWGKEVRRSTSSIFGGFVVDSTTCRKDAHSAHLAHIIVFIVKVIMRNNTSFRRVLVRGSVLNPFHLTSGLAFYSIPIRKRLLALWHKSPVPIGIVRSISRVTVVEILEILETRTSIPLAVQRNVTAAAIWKAMPMDTNKLFEPTEEDI